MPCLGAGQCDYALRESVQVVAVQAAEDIEVVAAYGRQAVMRMHQPQKIECVCQQHILGCAVNKLYPLIRVEPAAYGLQLAERYWICLQGVIVIGEPAFYG